MNEQIQILIDFHNLRLTPKIIRKPPKMKISRSQEQHLRHFIEENSLVVGVPGKVIRKTAADTYDNNVNWASKYVELAQVHKRHFEGK